MDDVLDKMIMTLFMVTITGVLFSVGLWEVGASTPRLIASAVTALSFISMMGCIVIHIWIA